jgi:hypothetical protein
MTIVALLTMTLLTLSMCRHLFCCQASLITLIACCQAGVVALVVMALLPLMRRHCCCCCNCNCCPLDNGIVAIVNAQASLLLLRWHCCPCNNGVVALDPQWRCCPCLDGIVPLLKLACCPCCKGIVVIINVVAHVAHCQAGVAAVNAQASLPLS